MHMPCARIIMTMRTNSPLFDRIRVKPELNRRLRNELPGCEWPGCKAPATHRAPKGRLRASEYWQFCLEHVRKYNNSYNFFGGMRARRAARVFRDADWSADDPFSLLGMSGARNGHARAAPEKRKIFNAQRRALDVLGLEADAKRADIKSKFKVLVKRHHPDANGGDRGSEARLREIIQAYNYLKSAGFC